MSRYGRNYLIRENKRYICNIFNTVLQSTNQVKLGFLSLKFIFGLLILLGNNIFTEGKNTSDEILIQNLEKIRQIVQSLGYRNYI